jgi:hypothetical protein
MKCKMPEISGLYLVLSKMQSFFRGSEGWHELPGFFGIFLPLEVKIQNRK